MPQQVLLADDHTILRETLRAFIESNGWSVVGEAGDGVAAVEMARTLRPDITILDISMPGLNGISAACEILHFEPQMNVLLLTVHNDDHFVFQALRAGIRAREARGPHRSGVVSADATARPSVDDPARPGSPRPPRREASRAWPPCPPGRMSPRRR